MTDEEYYTKYKADWANTPFPVIFQTVDAYVSCDSYLLLLKRNKAPGQGMFALPGGFLDANETLHEAVLRELREETGLYLDNLQYVRRTFDAVDRSKRGRVITTCFKFVLDSRYLPLVYPVDTYENIEPMWVHKGLLPPPNLLFEDHDDIIKCMEVYA